MNHALARALRGAGVSTIDVASRLRVDPKTVQRWLSGRMPYPRYRDALVELTGWSPRDLWPDTFHPAAATPQADEIRIIYPHRSAVPPDAWSRLFTGAAHEIGILAYSALFIAEDLTVSRLLIDKATAGIRVRIALGALNGKHVADRGSDERVGDAMTARIRMALERFRPVAEAGAEVRLHDTVLYNSIYRADGQMLINTHVYGHPAAHTPVVHLQRRGEGMADTYLESFERVWATSHKPPAEKS